MPQPASARLEFRLRPDIKRLVERAARLLDQPVSDFARAATEARARQVVEEFGSRTIVPPDYFDALLAALDNAPNPNPRLERTADAARAAGTHEGGR